VRASFLRVLPTGPLQAGPPLTLCRGNLASKTPSFTKSSKVSEGHRQPESEGGGRQGSPACTNPPIHPPVILTTSCRLAVQDKAHDSDPETQGLHQDSPTGASNNPGPPCPGRTLSLPALTRAQNAQISWDPSDLLRALPGLGLPPPPC
jgi:hypothetical protein